MKHFLYILLALTLAGAVASCTYNNGDIGIWFGTWSIDTLKVDGNVTHLATAGDTAVNYFMQFQSSVFRLSIVGPYHDADENFGTWQEGEQPGTMRAWFPDSNYTYILHRVPGMELDNHFTVVRHNNRRLVLTKTAANGHTYTYCISKNAQ